MTKSKFVAKTRKMSLRVVLPREIFQFYVFKNIKNEKVNLNIEKFNKIIKIKPFLPLPLMIFFNLSTRS